jgi:hypothetical protein
MFVSFDVVDDERMNALFQREAKLNLIGGRTNA